METRANINIFEVINNAELILVIGAWKMLLGITLESKIQAQ